MTTWNPADKAAGVTLSGGDLTATNNNGLRACARSTTSKNSGKAYLEVTADAVGISSFAAIATLTATSSLTAAPGGGANESAYYQEGSVEANGLGEVAAIATYTSGDVLGLAIDFDAGKGWYSKNGVFATGDPAAGTGEHFTFTAGTTLFAAIGTRRLNDAGTADFAAAGAPTGFSPWDAAPAVAAAVQPLTYGAAPLNERRVRAKYEEIEEIDRRLRAKEEAEREKARKQEEAKRQLAELEAKKRQTRTIAERRRKLEARIEAYQSEITALRTAMIALLDEIERARVEAELQQTIADRRRRMLLLIAAAA